MLRKVLTGAAAMALPLTGLAVWGGSQFAGAVAAPNFVCGVAGAVNFAPGTSYAGSQDLLPPGLTLAASPAVSAASPTGANVGDSTITVAAPLVKSGGVSLPEFTAIPGQQFKDGKALETITRVDNFIDGTKGLEHTPGMALITFSPPLVTAIAAGAHVAVAATTNTAGTVADVANSVETDISLTASGCSSNSGDFYPDTVGISVAPTQGTNAATSLEAKSAAIVGTVSFPSSAGDWVSTDQTDITDTLTFGAGAGAFCPASGAFGVLASGVAVPAGTAGSTGCTQGVYYYSKGKANGTYATTAGTATLGLNGIIACTETELTTAGDYPTKCDGEAGATDGVTDAQSAGLEFQNAEIYGSANGDCVAGINGWAANSCSYPLGGDGSPLAEIIGLTLAGGAAL